MSNESTGFSCIIIIFTCKSNGQSGKSCPDFTGGISQEEWKNI